MKTAKCSKEFIERIAEEIMKAKPNYVPSIKEVKEHMNSLYDAEFEDRTIWEIYMEIKRRVDDYMFGQSFALYKEEWEEL